MNRRAQRTGSNNSLTDTATRSTPYPTPFTSTLRPSENYTTLTDTNGYVGDEWLRLRPSFWLPHEQPHHHQHQHQQKQQCVPCLFVLATSLSLALTHISTKAHALKPFPSVPLSHFRALLFHTSLIATLTHLLAACQPPAVFPRIYISVPACPPSTPTTLSD